MTRHYQVFWRPLVAALLLIVGCTVALAETASEPQTATANVKIERIELGIKGVYKTGYWVPCRVFFNGPLSDDASVSLISLDPDGTPTRFAATINGDKTSADALVRIGRDNASLTVRIETIDTQGDANAETPLQQTSNRRFLAERVFQPRNTTGENAASASGFFPTPVPIERPVYLTLFTGDPGIEGSLAYMSLRESNRPLIVPLDSFGDLPDNPAALELVSLVALSANPNLYEGIRVDSPKLLALKRWLLLGGHVIFNAGRNSEPLLSGENALLADFLPGKFERMASLRLSSPYEVYISQFQHTTVAPINMTGTDESPFIELPGFSDPQGVVEASDMDLALIVRMPVGLGSLVYMGGDLDAAPISNWRDRSVFVAKLLGVRERTTQQNRERADGSSLVQLGYNDLAGQLRSALDQFENVKGISFTFVVILLVAYLVCVGVVDWLFVHKLLKRPQLTWLTFPCWIVLFGVIAAGVARQTQLDNMVANQAELIDIDTVTGTARGTAWVGVFSPDARICDLRFDADANAQNPTTRFAWFGLPGTGLGGMSPQTVSLAQWDTTYTLDSPGNVIDRLPMQTRSTRSLTAHWETSNYENMPIVADLVEQEGIPSGHIMNASSRHLTQCFIVYGRWVIELNELRPGTVAEVGTNSKRYDLPTVFSGGRNIFSETNQPARQMTGRYNSESVNIPYIIRSMMFYRASGGLDGFALHNAYQHSVDMSNLLPTHQAVLIGLVVEPENDEQTQGSRSIGSQIMQTVNGVEQPLDIAKRVTLLRVVLPVQNNSHNAAM